jgi:hypothetical protein
MASALDFFVRPLYLMKRLIEYFKIYIFLAELFMPGPIRFFA